MHTQYSSSNIEWSQQLKTVVVKSYQGTSGPSSTLPDTIKALFMIFFSSSVMDYIVQESNRYAEQCLGEAFTSWKPITPEELEAYMGFMILMGLVKLPCIYDYWKKDNTFHYSAVASRISRKRFFDLHRYLHFVDNDTLPSAGQQNYDKLGKVKPVLEMVMKLFASSYTPGENVSVDKAMVPFKGRSSLKQYMPKKPIKRGFKIWMAADALTGYVTDFDVVTGKKNDSVEKGLGESVVKRLTARFHDSFRHIYFDNFFSSVDLLVYLFRSGLYGCGTLRTNRKGFPQSLKTIVKKGMKDRGDSVTYQHKNMTISVWQDSKPVTVLATNSDPTISDTVSRKQRDGRVQLSLVQLQ